MSSLLATLRNHPQPLHGEGLPLGQGVREQEGDHDGVQAEAAGVQELFEGWRQVQAQLEAPGQAGLPQAVEAEAPGEAVLVTPSGRSGRSEGDPHQGRVSPAPDSVQHQ